MDRSRLRSGEFYKNAEQELFQIVTVAKHTKTQEELVIFQKLFGDYSVCAESVETFSENAEKICCPNGEMPQREQESGSPEDAQADPQLLRFLDADTYADKYKVLKDMEYTITDRLINDFAVILDVVIPEGVLSARYEQLKQCVATMARYETTRFR